MAIEQTLTEDALNISVKWEHDRMILTNEKGDTFTTKSEELMDFLFDVDTKLKLHLRDSEVEELNNKYELLKEDWDRLGQCAKQQAATIKELQDRLFTLGEMSEPPCFCCGYNGDGYYQPETHPCAARHHSIFAMGYKAAQHP